MIINEHYQIIETKHGTMIINSHDTGIGHTLLVKGEWGEQELALTKQYAKGIVLDVGANIGTHTLVYARTAEMVYAFEPQPFCFDMLCTNLLLNDIINVTPVQCALGPVDGITCMNIHDQKEQNSPSGERVGKGTSKVSMHKLDSLGIGKVDFIKMDIEGYELEALKGMTETIKKYKPVIYIEIHYQHLIDEIKEFLSKFGYASTALVITTVIFPDDNANYDRTIPQVYGFLFTTEEVVHESFDNRNNGTGRQLSSRVVA